jgi:IclR family pca regulon transcriptional regulator
MTVKERDFVGALAGGLKVIEAFDDGASKFTLSEIARKTGLSRAAARRYLLTLTQLNYCASDGKYFVLTPRVLALARAHFRAPSLASLVQPILNSISERTSESASAAILDGLDVAFIARSPGRFFVSVAINVGTRLPAYCCATGRALLSCREDRDVEKLLRQSRIRKITRATSASVAETSKEIATTRAKGFALSDEQFENGLRSIAVPVRNARGEAVLAIGIGTHSSRMTIAAMAERFLPELQNGQRILAAIL